MIRVTPCPPAAHTDTNPLPDPFSFNNLAMVAITPGRYSAGRKGSGCSLQQLRCVIVDRKACIKYTTIVTKIALPYIHNIYPI